MNTLVKIASYEDNLEEQRVNSNKKLILFGLSYFSECYFAYLPIADYFCDVENEQILNYHGIPRITLEEIADAGEEVDILFVKNKNLEYFEQFCLLLMQMKVKAKVYNFFINAAYPFLEDDEKFMPVFKKETLRVRIVNYDDGWILSKFADRMNQCLRDMGIASDVSACIDKNADINHHIPYHPFQPLKVYNDTLMITHVDSKVKISRLKEQLKIAKMGICMSKETVDLLTLNGVPRERLCYVNPAHDGNMKPKKYVLGITHRCYDTYDFRKRTAAIIDICKELNAQFFKLKIMGQGWQHIVTELRSMGFEIDYYDNFDYDLYHELIPSLDYYIFFGFDEGSMGYLDALAAGVKTIVTPQGFHLDVNGGIDYPCRNIREFADTLLEIQKEREQKIKAVEDWTWKNYTLKHLEIWNYITKRQSLSEIYKNQLCYNDGIFSVLIENNTI